jgi:predicted MFS family arabinose efflux permease
VGSVVGGFVAQHYGFPILYTGAGLLAIVSLAILLLAVPAMKTK